MLATVSSLNIVGKGYDFPRPLGFGPHGHPYPLPMMHKIISANMPRCQKRNQSLCDEAIRFTKRRRMNDFTFNLGKDSLATHENGVFALIGRKACSLFFQVCLTFF